MEERMTNDELLEHATAEYTKWYGAPDNGDEDSPSHEYVREIVPLLIEALAARDTGAKAAAFQEGADAMAASMREGVQGVVDNPYAAFVQQPVAQTAEHPGGEPYGVRLPKMTNTELIAEAEMWADGFLDGGLKGVQREMDAANLLQVMIDRMTAIVPQAVGLDGASE